MDPKGKKALKEVLEAEVRPYVLALKEQGKQTNELLKQIFERQAISAVPFADEKLLIMKGEKGETGPAGRDGKDAVITDALVEEIKKAVRPVKGRDYFDGAKGKDGKDAVITDELISEMIKRATPIKGVHYRDGSKGEKGQKGKDGTEISAEDVRDKLESLKGGSRLSMSAIKGLDEALKAATQSKGSPIFSGGASSGGSTGATSFLQLSDAPSSYSGQGGKGVRVNAGATALEFYSLSATGVTSVGSGAGLTGGPITSSGSLSIDYGYAGTWTAVQTHQNTSLALDRSSLNFSYLTAAASAPTIALVATSSGLCTNGSHRVLVTFVNALGETHGTFASGSVNVDSTHKQISLTNIPLGGSGTTGRNIYMTKVGGSTYYRVSSSPTINDNTTTTFTVNVADSSLSSVAPTSNTTSGVINFAGSKRVFFDGANGLIGINIQANQNISAALDVRPTVASIVGLSVQAVSGQSANVFQVLGYDGTAQHYVDSANVWNVSNSMRFRNIAGNSLLFLNASNVVSSLNPGSNISVNWGAQTISAIPSGSSYQYQFNNGGAFGANANASQSATDGSSTFVGNQITPDAASSFSGSTAYGTDAGAFTSGYSCSGASKMYEVYTYDINPTDGSKYYSVNVDFTTLTDNNSSITLPSVTGAINAGPSYGSGSYVSYNGVTPLNVYYKIVGSATYNGNSVFGTDTYYSETSISDYSPGSSFYVSQINIDAYTYPLGYTSAGFRMLRSMYDSYHYDYYLDVGGFPYDDYNSGWNPLFVTGTSSYQSGGNGDPGNYTANGTHRDYLWIAQWQDAQGNYYYSHLGYNIADPAHPLSSGGFDDSNDSSIYTGTTSTSGFAFPSWAVNPFYVVQRQVYSTGGTPSGFNEYFWPGLSTSVLDYSDLIWAYGSGLTGVEWDGATPTSVKNFFHNSFTWTPPATGKGYLVRKSEDSGSTWVATLVPGLATASFEDTGGLPWADSADVSVRYAGPFGATIGGKYGVNTIGPLRVNDAYSFPSAASPGGNNYFQYWDIYNEPQWAPLTFASIGGTVSNSQIPFGYASNGPLLFGNGSLNIASGVILDFGTYDYQSLTTPSIRTYSSGIKFGPAYYSNYWQIYCPSADLSFYNLNGSYGEWMSVSNSTRKITFPVGKINIQNLPTSTSGLSSGDLWCDTTGGLNIIKIV